MEKKKKKIIISDKILYDYWKEKACKKNLVYEPSTIKEKIKESFRNVWFVRLIKFLFKGK